MAASKRKDHPTKISFGPLEQNHGKIYNRTSHRCYHQSNGWASSTPSRLQSVSVSSHDPYARWPTSLEYSDCFYTAIWNVLDYPAVAFPVTEVLAEGQVEKRTDFYNHEDEALWNLFSKHDFSGAPIGLQLAGRTQEEEAVLAMTTIVAQALAAFGK